uniref:Uncharacterized protein n=1 Tax=Parastrongyloides trichosuri TaxID=131310 RepID=A0A0N4ZF27_PARTI
MFRSIKRSRKTIQIENLLDTMRYREELESYTRNKRKLQKAKNKVTAWLNKNNNKMWTSSAYLLGSHGNNYSTSLKNVSREDSKSSNLSFIPDIIISPSNDDKIIPKRRKTPSLSLIYNFDSNLSQSVTSNFSISIEETGEAISPFKL